MAAYTHWRHHRNLFDFSWSNFLTARQKCPLVSISSRALRQDRLWMRTPNEHFASVSPKDFVAVFPDKALDIVKDCCRRIDHDDCKYELLVFAKGLKICRTNPFPLRAIEYNKYECRAQPAIRMKSSFMLKERTRTCIVWCGFLQRAVRCRSYRASRL